MPARLRTAVLVLAAAAAGLLAAAAPAAAAAGPGWQESHFPATDWREGGFPAIWGQGRCGQATTGGRRRPAAWVYVARSTAAIDFGSRCTRLGFDAV